MTKKHILTLIFGYVGLFAVLVAFDTVQYNNADIPAKIETQATVEERIATGLCTFGDCPVLLPTQMSVTSFTTEPDVHTTAPTTEADKESFTTEHVSNSYTFDPEPVTESHNLIKSRSGYIGTMYVTGYTAEEGFPEGSATASGYGVRPGYCAMNDSQRQALGIRYGDRIYVEGLGTYTVMDCGCGWGVVDIWVYTDAEAYAITGNYAVYYGG